MKKILLIALAMLTLGSITNDTYAANDKKDKKKKEIKWDWDGTRSGNSTVDNYLVEIDNTYRKIQQYKETMDNYQMMGDTININGKYYAIAYMLNAQNELVTRGQVNWQCANAVADGMNIVLDITNAQLLTVDATLALPELGLKAISFGKYVKGGAAVFAQGIKEIKAIRGTWVANSKKWKSLKNGAIQDPASLNYFDEAALKKLNKCCYIKEILPEDADYTAIVESKKAKSEEELKADADAFAQQFAQYNMAPEDASKSLDDISDEELEKELNA